MIKYTPFESNYVETCSERTISLAVRSPGNIPIGNVNLLFSGLVPTVSANYIENLLSVIRIR